MIRTDCVDPCVMGSRGDLADRTMLLIPFLGQGAYTNAMFWPSDYPNVALLAERARSPRLLEWEEQT